MLETTIRVNIDLKEQLGFDVYFAFQNVYHFHVCPSVKNFVLSKYLSFLKAKSGGGEKGKE